MKFQGIAFSSGRTKKNYSTSYAMDEFHRFAEEDSCSIHGCQPSAGGGVGERRQKPRAGQCLVCVFGDGRRTPRLRVMSLLCLCSDMLKRARGSGRRGVVIRRCVECREREMCCKCSKYVSESEREREEGCGICKVLGVQRERDRDAL